MYIEWKQQMKSQIKQNRFQIKEIIYKIERNRICEREFMFGKTYLKDKK